MAWGYAIVSVVLVSLLSLVGIFFLAADPARLRRILLILVSFAIGGLAGDAFIHLIPEAFRDLGIRLHTSLLIILGMIVFFGVEKLIRWRHCHIPTSAQHVPPVAALNLVGDAVHNLIDGIVIGASYAVGIPVGVTTTLAVILHEIPQEIGDFGILVHAGLTARKALLLNFASALLAVFCPVTDLLNLGHSTENSGDGGPPKSFVKAFGPRAADTAAWQEIGRAMSPIYHVTGRLPPVLIYHGDADTLVPLEQSEWFVARVREAGGTVTLVVRHGKKHGWLTAYWDIRQFGAWFDRYLRQQQG